MGAPAAQLQRVTAASYVVSNGRSRRFQIINAERTGRRSGVSIESMLPGPGSRVGPDALRIKNLLRARQNFVHR